ncbi:uncharacterized protein LOC134241547 [Saccostrea cucullata]|uniref:uncharacterized protein LOC134241547 n=1 Tax=Saccostrea cuccullata TaxID=36930 RepID=UPI002ED35000
MPRKGFVLVIETIVICLMSCMTLSPSKFPEFIVVTNASLLTFGDTVVIKCLIANMTLMDVVTGYTLTWFKDDVRVTESFTVLSNDVRDSRYSLNIFAEEGKGFVSSLQIKSLKEEDEGLFTCELQNNTSAKQQKSVSISGIIVESFFLFRSILSDEESSTSTTQIQNIDRNTTDTSMYMESITESNLEKGNDSVSITNDTFKDNKLTTQTNVVSFVEGTTASLEGEFHSEKDNKAGMIVGIMVPIILILVTTITVAFIIKRRGGINWEICYHKSKGKDYEKPHHELINIDYENRRKKRKSNYIKCNDTTFLDEYNVIQEEQKTTPPLDYADIEFVVKKKKKVASHSEANQERRLATRPVIRLADLSGNQAVVYSVSA